MDKEEDRGPTALRCPDDDRRTLGLSRGSGGGAHRSPNDDEGRRTDNGRAPGHMPGESTECAESCHRCRSLAERTRAEAAFTPTERPTDTTAGRNPDPRSCGPKAMGSRTPNGGTRTRWWTVPDSNRRLLAIARRCDLLSQQSHEANTGRTRRSEHERTTSETAHPAPEDDAGHMVLECADHRDHARRMRRRLQSPSGRIRTATADGESFTGSWVHPYPAEGE